MVSKLRISRSELLLELSQIYSGITLKIFQNPILRFLKEICLPGSTDLPSSCSRTLSKDSYRSTSIKIYKDLFKSV